MIDFVDEIKTIQHEIVSWRRELHQIPETGHDIPNTAEYIKKQLKEMGIPYKDNIGGLGIAAVIEGSFAGKTIAMRADMDALAVEEKTELPFASKNGNMHACGHDAHMAMLLGAAKVLNSHKAEMSGKIKLIFQPAEEGPGGAKPMIEAGVLEDPKVDAAISIHVGDIFPGVVNTGNIGICYGTVQACLDRFKIKIKGKGCHGAMPHTGVDPITIAGHVINALQTIVSREVKPTNPAVVTIGKLHGGSSYNIIPDYVELDGTARAIDQGEREKIAAHIESIVAGITRGMQGDYEYEYIFGYPPMKNDPEFTKDMVESIKKVVDEKDIVEIIEPTMGGEDFAYFLLEVPGTYMYLGTNNPEKGIVYPQHNAKFDVDEDLLWKGGAVMAQGAWDWLEKNK